MEVYALVMRVNFESIQALKVRVTPLPFIDGPRIRQWKYDVSFAHQVELCEGYALRPHMREEAFNIKYQCFFQRCS